MRFLLMSKMFRLQRIEIKTFLIEKSAGPALGVPPGCENPLLAISHEFKPSVLSSKVLTGQ